MRSESHAKSAECPNESSHATAALVPTITGQTEGQPQRPQAPIISEALRRLQLDRKP
jgi:hypothetical protein